MGGDGQLGDGGTADSFSRAVQVRFPAALSSTGDVWAWGDGSAGQLGDGGTGVARKPELVASGGASISATASDVAVQAASGNSG